MTISEETYFNQLETIEKNYSEIIKGFDNSFPQAINNQEEKKKFFSHIEKGEIYNPQFKYEEKILPKSIIKKLKNFKIDTTNDIYGFKKLYKERIKYKIYEYYAHKYWGEPKSTKYSILYRGKPSWYLLQKAKLYCKNYKRQKVRFTKLTPEIISTQLKEEVEKLTKDKLRVIFVDLPNKININPIHKIIKINHNERFTSLDLKRLKVHEIGTHYLRYYNGHLHKIRLLETGTANYISTEEGLAAYMEELTEVSSKAQMYIYAGRVIATYYAQSKSFYELYQILKKYGFKDKDAYSLTFRAKRNISDTSKPGGFTKDYVYFKGYFEVKEFAKKHDIKDLFIGKIRIKDVKILRKFIDKHKSQIKTILD